VATEVELPQLGESVTEGVITAWLVEVGDEVEVDQPIVEISTDKVDTEIPSPVAGTVQELKAEVDDEIQVGQVIAVIGDGDASSASDSGSDDTTEDDTGDEGDEDLDEGGEDAGGDDRDASASSSADQDDPGSSDEPASGGGEYVGGEGGTTSGPASASSAPSGGKVERGEGHDTDVIIIGGGTGGYSAALRAAQLGLDVVLVERDKVGGTCLHWGCIPTKAILQTAEVAEHAQEAADFGVTVDYQGIEVAALNAHKDGVVDKMWKGLQGALKGRGVETVQGTATLTSADTVEIDVEGGDRRTVSAPAIVIATGSKPKQLPFAEFDGKRIISSDHAMNLEKLPKKAIILGSGAVGMEFATAWNAFGVEVTIVEMEDRLLPLEDADSSKEIGRAFRKRGIKAMTSAKVSDVSSTSRSVTVTVETTKGEEELKADLLLVAIGRGPVTEGAGLEDAGVEIDDRGFVTVDEYCRTNVDGIYALGDVIATLGLAHASFAEGFLVADQLGGLDVLPIDYKGVPRVTYSHPEVASVGYTEAEAKDAGFEVVTERYPFQALGRAAMAKATGMVKLIAEKDDQAEGGAGRVLGVHLVGPRATDLISEGQLIYNWEALPTDVAHLIHAHPSFGEAIGEAHLALAGRALHG
jgi:dihydrolipoamide dehydrogenase